MSEVEGSEELNVQRLSWQQDPLWYKDAIIYQLHVKAFHDSNDDGIGDFRGLTEKLDYLQDLGVNTLWLLPFYPSPFRDDGYDISDYRNIHPGYGTRSEFHQFVRQAHRRGLKVITELVINHTSDQHPWFQAARRAPKGSAKRNFYVWSDTDKKFPETRIIFTDSETSNWAWDPVAQQYYWHRFFSHQPDLNHNNPNVVKAVIRIMRFWLDFGVDGMRLDAIPYLCVREGTYNENLPETHAVLKEMRKAIDAHYTNRMFLAEANQWPEDVRDYFGNGDECHVAYHFPLMPRMFMAVAQEDRFPIAEIMRQTPDIPDVCQWAIFLRNHDELTLEMVTDRERDYMYSMYAADPRMRVNVGIRRRLAPLMQNDADRIKLMNSLLLSMPGSPIVYYGDEIGMGDNVYLGDRNGVRTPMQWSSDRNAGFSRADPQRLYLPPIMDAIYGFEAVNVEAQARSPSSLLNWTKRIIAVRKAHQAFSRGMLTFIRPGNRKILCYVREYAGEAILCVANLSRSSQPVELDLTGWQNRVPVELMGGTAFPPVGELPYFLTLPGYGFYWLKLATDVSPPSWHAERLPPYELPILVLPEGLSTLLEDDGTDKARRARAQFASEVLPPYLAQQRWFAAKGDAIKSIAPLIQSEWKNEGGNWLVSLLRIETSEAAAYFVPLSLVWDEGPEERLSPLAPCTLAKVRQHARVGVLVDAFGHNAFCRALVSAMREKLEFPLGGGKLKFSSTSIFSELTEAALDDVRHPALEQSNTAVFFGEKLFLKGYRRLQQGINPELEMGRFLTEVSPFPNIVPVAGAVEYIGQDGETMTLALLQGFVQNQGDGWTYTLDYLERFLTSARAPAESADGSYHDFYLALMRTLGLRTGEMHAALSKKTGDPLFDPEPLTAEDVRAASQRVQQDARATLSLLEKRIGSLPESLRDSAARLINSRAQLFERVWSFEGKGVAAIKTRYHGDYHLGQVLLVRNDYVIIDFEGEPARPLAERRLKHSALKDVAGMLRSFNYAASVALKRGTSERPEDRAQLAPALRDWENKTREAFLAGYGEGAAACYPQENASDLIALFTLEKALYELRYELNNRPDWSDVPIGGLLDLLQTT
ncbi:MAG: maltose alpha-D-glucosyltransferase [Burkholderiales bacterium]